MHGIFGGGGEDGLQPQLLVHISDRHNILWSEK
jgi:hypothetical protein